MVVGWSLSERMTAGIVANALSMTKSRGYVAENAIFHSGRDSQYSSRMVAMRANSHDVRPSVGRTGSWHDNAVAEPFFATLKNEIYSRRSFPTRTEAKTAVIEYTEGFYNRKRPHSTTGYQIPAETMQTSFDGNEEIIVGQTMLPLAA